MNITSLERRALLVVTSIFSLRMLGLFMILPVFATYANQLNNTTPLLVGIALGVYGLTQALLQIPFGFLSDRVGRKPVIVGGLLLFAVGSGIAALSDSIYGVILGRSLQGMSAIGCVMMALMVDLTRAQTRVWAMAILGLAIGISFMLAMILGPFLSYFLGVRSIFWLTAVLSLLAIAILVVFVPNREAIVGGEVIPQFKQLRAVCMQSSLRPLNAGVFVLHAVLVALFLKLPGILERVGVSLEKTGSFYFWVFLGSIIPTALCLFLLEKREKTLQSLAVVILLLACATLGIMAAAKAFGVALSLVAFFTAFNILEASLPSLVSKLSPATLKGTALGVYSSSQFLGIFGGGIVGGWLDASYGMVGIVLFCMTLTFMWFLWVFTAKWRGVERWQEV
jgi:predicted MFS family arabinose efflux permease